MKSEYVTVDRTAKELSVHIGTVQRWIRQGRLPATKVGRRYLIPAKSLEDLKAVGKALGVAPEPKLPLLVASVPEELDLFPVWLQFPPTWYRRLYLIAQTCSLTAAETITRGIELVLKENENKHKHIKTE